MSVLDLVPGIGWLRLAGKAVARPLAAAWSWLVADWRNGPLAFLGLLVAVHLLVIDPGLRGERDSARSQRDTARKELADTRAAIAAAAQAAALAQTANLARVKAAQDRISERIADDYQDRIAAVRVRADDLARRLRKPAQAAASGTGSTGLPGPGAASGRAATAAPGAGLPAASAELTLAERLVATEQAVQLDALIDWVIAQAAVSTSPEALPQKAPGK